MVDIEFICPHCQKDNRFVAEASGVVTCKGCQQPTVLQLSEAMTNERQIDTCALCGDNGFYLQKDFNPRLGLIIFAIGVLFSYHTKLISLFVATAIDFILFYVLPTVTICYHCRAIYRGFKQSPAHKGFDHLTALKYSKVAT